MRVRRAVLKDLDWLVEQVGEFMEFAGYNSLHDPEYLPQLAIDIVANHFCIVAEHEGQLVGMLAARKGPHPFNPKRTVLAELCWWVPAAHRHTRAGLALLTTYMEWGKRNADIVTMSALAHSPFNKASLLKRGFEEKEITYVWEKK